MATVPPALWLGLTFTAYLAGVWLQVRAGNSPIVNPVLVAIGGVILALLVTATEYDTYFSATLPLHLALGPAVVALAVPLYRQLRSLRRALPAAITGILVGGTTACATALCVALLFGTSEPVALSLATRSVTAPVAMDIAGLIGGIPALAAVAAIMGGILGAVLGDHVLDAAGVRDQRARGLAVGCASHAIGTARQLQQSAEAGAYGGLALGLHAIAAAFLLPLILGWLAG